ncbi:MAG TPA: hypothetical protein VH590_03590, partial [Ktedonobacterales bacterium]
MARSPDDLPLADEESLSDERLPLTDLESVGNRPPSRRKRAVQMALLALAVCVALALVWSTIAPGKRQTTQPNTTLTPTRVLLVSNLTNATITLNGKKLSGALPQVVSAYLEKDDITIAAPRFRPHTCHFVQLKATGDNAHCLFTTSGALNGPSLAFGIFLTPDDLLPGQQQALASITQQLAAAMQAAVLPGDYLATAFDSALGAITSQRAATALQASASFVQAGSLNAPAPPFPYQLTPACAQLLCPTGSDLAGAGTAEASGPVWNLLLNVMLRWRFTDAAGA